MERGRRGLAFNMNETQHLAIHTLHRVTGTTQHEYSHFIYVADAPSLLAAFRNGNSGAPRNRVALVNGTRELDVSRHAHQAPRRASYLRGDTAFLGLRVRMRFSAFS